MNGALPLVDLSRGLPGGPLWRPLAALAERCLGLDQVNALYEERRPGPAGAPAFCARFLDGLGVSVHVDAGEIERLQALKGPVVVLANHPLGGREALAMNVLLARARQDYRVLANALIGRVPEVRDHVLLVDPFGGPAAAQSNRTALRQALRYLGQGGLLGIFPAGEVSLWQPHEGRVADGPWSPQTARLLRLSGATVVPLHFSGRSSTWLRALGRVHPALKTPFLAREMMHGPARALRARFGHALPAAALPALDDGRLAAWLRDRCYALADPA